MCLTINKKKEHRGYKYYSNNYIINKYAKISNKDIKVYKTLAVYYDILKTPYWGTNIDSTGDILIADYFSIYEKYFCLEINQGIHAHFTVDKNIIKKNKYTDQLIVECIIPAGTPYFIGRNNDIVSLILIIPPIKPDKNNKYKNYYAL